MLVGFKTLSFGLLLAIGTPALAFLANFDWTTVVSAKWAVTVIGAIIVVLRSMTKTPMGSANPAPPPK